MKLLFIASADSIHSKKWVQYFAKRGHHVHWVSFMPFQENIEGSVSYYFVRGSMPSRLLQTRRIVQRVKPDILHAHYAGLNGTVGALCGFHPFVLTAWGSDVLISGKSWWKRPFIQYALRVADLVTCDALHMKKAIMNFGVSASKIQLIYFGIDTKRFCPGERDATFAEHLEIGDRSVVISMRNFEPVYDIGTLIRAIPFVAGKCPGTLFLLGGKGSEIGMLKKLIQDLGVERHVKFLGWIVNEDLPKYLRLADISVSTALSDGGISGTTAEAMACGIPAVVTDSGENSAWIQDGRDGCIVPVKNPRLLAQKIITLLQSPELRKQFGERGRAIIAQRNDYEAEMKKMEHCYAEIANTHGTR